MNKKWYTMKYQQEKSTKYQCMLKHDKFQEYYVRWKMLYKKDHKLVEPILGNV